MKLRWWALFALVIGMLMGPHLALIPGYVMVGTGQYTVEARLSLSVALLIVVLLGTLLVGAALGTAGSLKGHVRNLVRSRRVRRARLRTQDGIRALTEGRWSDAEAMMLEAARASESKLLNYLGAAMAAQELGALDRRDKHLRMAHVVDPEADLAVGLTEARLHLRSGHYEHALVILQQLDRIEPRNAAMLKLLQHVLRQVGDYNALEKLLPRLRKFDVLPTERLDKLEMAILSHRLGKSRDVEMLRTLWRSASKAARRDVATFTAYVQALVAADAIHEAERMTRKYIETAWNKDLIALYGNIPGRDAALQLTTAEQWALKREPDAIMLMTFAKLAVRAQNWIKAQRYLNQLVKLAPSAEAWLMLADVYERLQEPDQVKACISAALKQAKR
ncbi:MAG TPA: heme biosynthesis HemY N-terminal domain-containing protein [Permianibacter sp.]|nr:heme biosynthesis HemY N-terminal domain-containing protein [Permianibacter sp.]